MHTATIEHGPARAAVARRPHRAGTERWQVSGSILSEDDLTMIRLFAEGWCVDQIARRMYMSERTIRRRSRSVCDRLGVASIIQVVAWAARRRLV